MAERKVLHSWKDIANYMGRGVRTIQRYEVQLGLPVHRPAAKNRSSVMAFSDEIDVWLNRAPTRTQSTELSGSPPKLTEEQVKQQLAMRANIKANNTSAKRNREKARAAHEACRDSAKRLEQILERMKSFSRPRNSARVLKSSQI